MKRTFFTLIIILSSFGWLSAQMIADFDGIQNCTLEGWPNWAGTSVNPDPSGINLSANVGHHQRTGEMWGHAAVFPTTNFDFSVNNTFKVKVYSPIACNVLFKLENTGGSPGPVELLDTVHVANQWVELEYNFSTAPSNVYNKLVIFFDFMATTDNLFYFDDLELVAGTVTYSQIDIPIDFEATNVNYTLTDFGDASTTLGADPVLGTNTVAITNKPLNAPVWAGTTMSTPAGFASAIPFSTLNTKITVKVYSPAIGTPVRLKVEDHTNNQITCEVEVNTTAANAWETMEFDFTNPVANTAALDFANTYDMASIFFDFGSVGTGSTFYWDDVEFPLYVLGPLSLPINFDTITVNYTLENWGGNISEVAIDPVDPTNMVGKTHKPVNAEWWSGTACLGDASGLVSPIPFTTTKTRMSMRVYSPAVGTPVMMKVEDIINGGSPCETVELTTVANAWETLEFDFLDQQPGTPALNLATTYNKVALFFDFGNVGAGLDYYWDDIDFIDIDVFPTYYEIFTDFDFNENDEFEGWPNWPTKVMNIDQTGINPSDSVGQWVRSTEQYGHIYSNLNTVVDFTTYQHIHVKVYSPIACSARLKLETQAGNGGIFENSQDITVVNGWQELIFDFTGASSGVFDKMVIFFDFATFTDNTFYFDDVELGPPPPPESVIINDFDANQNYQFGGWPNAPVEMANTIPGGINVSDSIASWTRTGETWAHVSTTLSAPLDLFNLPYMTMKVNSPIACTILFKLESSLGALPTERSVSITTPNEWQELVFDFSGEATEMYNIIVIFFDFATNTDNTFYFDDVIQYMNVNLTPPADVQTVNFNSGWGIFSTYIEPYEASLDSVFEPIVSDIVLVKNGNGTVYWPLFGLNAIGNLTIGEGYQINTTSAQVLDIVGTSVQPETTVVNIPQGWSIMGYLRQAPADIEVLFAAVSTDIIIIKNGNGTVYWPFFGLNAIGNMNPGEGYLINTSVQINYSFPANAASSKSHSLMNNSTYFNLNINTGINHTLAIPNQAWKQMPSIGDEIAVFSQTGDLVGAGTYQGDDFVVTIWGDDELSGNVDGLQDGEVFELVYWNSNTGSINSITIDSWEKGSNLYEKNGISIAEEATIISNNFIVECYPNPANDFSTLRFNHSSDEFVEISVYNCLGVKLETLQLGTLPMGDYNFELDLTNYPSGSYFYRIQTSDKLETLNLQIVK